jgi:CheY-like chemotaxis protein
MVDDSEVNRELFGFMMEGQTLDIDYAHNGQQAYERVQSQRYDLVLMDLQMPVMDGFQSAALIRDYYQEQKLPQLPILALTAEVEKTAAKQCLDAGMKGCITKPIVYEKLLAHIRPWLERPCDQSEQDELSEASENAASGESESPLLGTDQPLLDSAFLDRQRQHIRPQAFVLMVNVYIEETQQRLEALGALFSTTISAEQMDAIAAQAHVLKSSAASFGALRMADLAIRLEAQAKSETKLDPLLLTALQLCFAELGTQLKAMC